MTEETELKEEIIKDEIKFLENINHKTIPEVEVLIEKKIKELTQKLNQEKKK